MRCACCRPVPPPARPAPARAAPPEPAARCAAGSRSDVARARHPLDDLAVGEREVAGGEVAALLALELRFLRAAELLRLPAAGVEAARRRRIGRRGDVAREQLALLGR